MKKLGVGIVGANWAARGHLPGWRMLPDRVEALAVCTTRADTAQAAAEKLGLPRAYHVFQDLLNDPDIDIVSLGAPPPARYEMTMASLARNKHVFSCVPFAVTIEQADAMTALQEERGLVGAVDAYFLWTPGFGFFKDLIEDEFLGELYAVSVDFSMSQFVKMRADYPYRWTGSAANGTGILPNSCSHIFHLLIHLFGPVEEVIGATRISNKLWMFEDGTSQVPEVADTAVLLARLAGGALVNIHAGRAVPSATGFCVSAYGSKGRLLAASPAYPLDRTVTITAAKAVGLFQRSDENLEIPSRYFEVFGGRVSRESDAAVSISLGRLLSAMLDAIDGGGEAIPSFRRAAHVQHIIAALRRSELSKCWQKVETEMTYPYVANRC